MAGLFQDCREYFETDDLYAVLDVGKTCQDSQLKRAYHKLSLKVHPDRVSEDEKAVATKKFQTLGKVYSILSDKEKRAVYDETGEVDEENDIAQDRDWYEYWRLLFPKITVEDIKEYEQKYRGSSEEVSDLVSAYMDSEGDMETILSTVLCCTHEDEGRFRKILMEKIENEELPRFPHFTDERSQKKKQRQKKAAKEAEEAEKMKDLLGLGSGDDALKKMIQQRQGQRQRQQEDFFAQLEAKYAPAKKKGKETPKKKGTAKK